MNRREVEKLLTMDEALKAVEYAFKLEAKGRTIPNLPTPIVGYILD